MTHFWRFASRLGRRKMILLAALTMAFVSAAGLGAGLLAIMPTLDMILGDADSSLRSFAQERAGRLPAGVIESLPTDRFVSVAVLIGGLTALTIFGAMANFLHSAISYRLSVRTIGDIRRDLFRHTLHLPLSRIAGRSSDTISRILSDTEVLLGGFVALTSKAAAQITRGIIGLAVAFIIDWRLTMIALIVAPILYLIVRKLGKRVRRASRGAMRARAELLNVASESLQGQRVVKVYTSERRELDRFTRHNRNVVAEHSRALTMRALGSPLTETISVIFLGLLTLLASKAIIDGALQIPNFITTLAALATAGSSIKPLTRAVQEVQMSEAAAARLVELLEEDPEPIWTRRRGGTRRPRLPRHCRSIAFEDVRFTYPGAAQPALDGVSLTIEHGQTIAFVGPNGSGKTTLLSLVPRLYEPTAGRLLIDGVDIAQTDLRSLRKQIGVVTQETVIFRTSVAENIAFGARSASREAVVAAARHARADDFISALPGGYDSVVGEQGATLSGGQRQRLAIARAVLRDPAILILDEATSMIDAESEHMIAEALNEFSSGRTCLIVAHRLSTVVSADRIVVMDRGRIAATGTHEELLETCPLYQRLAKTQLAPAGV